MDNDKISQALGLPPSPNTLPEVVVETTPALPVVTNETATNDMEMVRVNLHDTINIIQGALTELSQFASQAQSARAFEALTEMVKASGEINMRLMELHERKKNVLTPAKGANSETPSATVNNLYVTSDALLTAIQTDNKQKAEANNDSKS